MFGVPSMMQPATMKIAIMRSVMMTGSSLIDEIAITKDCGRPSAQRLAQRQREGNDGQNDPVHLGGVLQHGGEITEFQRALGKADGNGDHNRHRGSFGRREHTGIDAAKDDDRDQERPPSLPNCHV